MTRIQLKEAAKKLPNQPGIYLFTDGKNKPLYIGKALNLKNRVNQYLKTDDIRLNKMLSEAKKISFIKTGSDIEALILESQYIKKHQPRFNIMLRDDKQYFYVGFTHSTKPQGGEPVESTGSGQADVFPKIILTHQPHGLKGGQFIGPFTDGSALKSTLKFLRRIFPYCTCVKPHNNFCLNYHTGHCVGFCCLKTGKYDKEVLDNYKHNIRALKDILNGKRKSLLKDLSRKMSALAKKEDFEKAINLKSKIEKLKRVFENAKVIKEFRPQKTRLDELAKILHLAKPPYRIEGYDVSNIQGANATGSMVVFENGVPARDKYRKFKIKGKRKPDDTFMLSEVLQRRFSHPEWQLPNLILIDGGKGQLLAAASIIPEKIPIIALAKDEKHQGSKIYILGRKDAIPLSRLPISIKTFLLRIDSEAHRFAIEYYRKLHIRQLLN